MNKWIMALAAVLGLGFASQAHAVLLAPGTTTPPGAFFASIEGGTFTVLNDTGPLAFSFAGNTGTVEETVGTFTGNPFGATSMTFIYQLHVDTGIIEHVSGANYLSFSTDVGWNAGTPGFMLGVGTRPVTLTDSVTRSADGSVVEFNFDPAVPVGPLS